MQFRPNSFKLYELIDPWTYEAYGETAWEFLDPLALRSLQKLRDNFGKATVNDWKWGGKRKYAGFRPPQCRVGAKLSQHRLGRGFDPIFSDATSEEIRESIKNGIIFLPGVGAIENIVSWFHFDTRPTVDGQIKWFNP